MTVFIDRDEKFPSASDLFHFMRSASQSLGLKACAHVMDDFDRLRRLPEGVFVCAFFAAGAGSKLWTTSDPIVCSASASCFFSLST
mmetsp:Transcript_21690/g.38120  ORF Transcript_21690/g.38120 Transcript_21690/m.38120 type:complete len:86 (+) Transcript_21690:24-281(+)